MFVHGSSSHNDVCVHGSSSRNDVCVHSSSSHNDFFVLGLITLITNNINY